jgi:HAD superfamily hydrolase (TIGR01509 family)
MYEAIIFDLDGTLIDSERVSFEEFQKLCATFGKEFTSEQHTLLMGRSGAENNQIFRERFNVPVTDEQMISVREGIRQRMIQSGELALKPGVRKFLQELSLAGYRLGIATASSPTYRETILRSSGIIEFFEGFVSGEEVAMPKPAPDIYLAVAKKFGVDPMRCLAVEDGIVGVQSGCAAQMDVLGIRDRLFFDDLPGVKRIIDSFDEITVDDIAAMSVA